MSRAALNERRELLLARSTVLRTSLALQTRLLVLGGRKITRPAHIATWLISHPATLAALLLAAWRPWRTGRLALQALRWSRILAPLLKTRRSSMQR